MGMVSEELRRAAKELRKAPTPAEARLWRPLRDRAVNGLKFRRQHPMERFILDFYCAEVRLCVELDGGIHEQQQEQDAERTAWLASRGIRVVRFRNEEVMEDLPSVLRRLVQEAGAMPER